MRIWLKIRAILGWLKFVSAYVERDKKILKLAVFGVQVAALLIESFSTWFGGGKNWVPDKGVLGSVLRFEIFAFAPLYILLRLSQGAS